MDSGVEEYVLNTVKKCSINDLTISDISLNTRIIDLHMDSLSVLELVYELEDCFEITLDVNALSKLENICEIASMVDAAVTKAA